MYKSITKFIAAALFTTSGVAFAHTGHDVSGWGSGWVHPFLGLDHMLAMLAVGLWAMQGGGRRVWLLPVTFMTMLAVGAGISMMLPYSLPLLETGIALSVLALGLLISLSLHLPIWQSIALTALFGILHGYAHGLELPSSTSPFAYSLGFLSATAVLHLGGISIGATAQNKYVILAKLAGGLIAMCGIGLLTYA